MSKSVNNIPQSLGSLGKHEHQIPQVDATTTLCNFFSQRQHCLDMLKTAGPAENALQLPEPVRTLMTQLNTKPGILRKIEKRFVINSDIAAKALPQLHRLDNMQQLWVKVQVAQALLTEFNQRTDINSLNSAVRLTDAICHSTVNQPLPANLQQDITVLLEAEQAAISRLQHEQN